VNEQELQAIEQRAAASENELYALCQRQHEWRMCIPVQSTDSDVVLGKSLTDIRALLAEVRRLQEIESRAVTINNALLDAIQSMMPFLTPQVQERMQQALQPVIDLMEQKP